MGLGGTGVSQVRRRAETRARANGAGRGGADSRTPAGRLLRQLQPVDRQAVGTAAHTAALALALHVALGLAQVGRLDLVAAVTLSAKLQPGIQVTPTGGGCQAGRAPPWCPQDKKTHPGQTTDGATGRDGHSVWRAVGRGPSGDREAPGKRGDRGWGGAQGDLGRGTRGPWGEAGSKGLGIWAGETGRGKRLKGSREAEEFGRLGERRQEPRDPGREIRARQGSPACLPL